MKYYTLIFTVFLCLALNTGCAQSDELLDSIFTNKIDPHSNTPGVAVAVIKNKKIVYKKTFGMANLEYDTPLSSNSVFDIASLAKQFTGFAIAKLILDDKLSMETAVIDLLPELNNLPPTMKVRHLVHHTSGIRDIGELFAVGHFGDKLTAVEALKILKRQKGFNFELGTESDYSNSNYVLLAIIVERVSKKSFRSYCDEHIFEPLDMTHSFANDNHLEIVPDRAVAYYTDGEGFSFQQNNGMSLIGSSAVYSSIDDMAKWAIAMQGGNSFDPIIELMKKDGKTNDGKPTGYGFGLGLGNYQGLDFIEHTGATPSGFRSAITWFPSADVSVVFLSNWGDLDLIGDFGHSILGIFVDSENQQTAELPQQNEEIKESVVLTNSELDKFVGDYLFNNEMPISIKRDGIKLVIAPNGQEPMDLVPLGVNQLDFPAFRSLLKFGKDERGKYNNATVYAGPNSEEHGSLVRILESDQGELEASNYIGHYYSEELGTLLEIEMKEDQLLLHHEKHGTLGLHSISLVHFQLDGELASNIKFRRGDGHQMERLLLSRGSRMRDVPFLKVVLP